MKKILSKLADLYGKCSKSTKKMCLWFRAILKKIGGWISNLSKTKYFHFVFKVFVSLVVILALGQIFLGVSTYAFKANNNATKLVSKILPIPVAVVNYDFVTLNDYQNEKDYIHHFYTATKQDTIDFKAVDVQVLDQLIENKIIASQAIRYRVKVEKKDVDDAINNIVVQNGGQDKVEKVLDDLYGLSLKKFTKLVKVQMLRDKVNDKVIARVGARHILIRADATATPEQVEAARVKITGILTEIQNGLDFGEAAKKYSEDTGSAADGGVLQPFAQGEMVQEFSDTAFKTNVGEISQPVKTEFGWHIIKVESKTGIVEKKFSDWMDGLKDKSLILKFYEGN